MAMAEASQHHKTQDRRRETLSRQGGAARVHAPTAAMYTCILFGRIHLYYKSYKSQAFLNFTEDSTGKY